MIETSHIRGGRWGLSRIVVDSGGAYTSHAAVNRLADHIEMHYPPLSSGGYVVDVCVVRLRGNIQPSPDGDTVLLPRNLIDIADIELGELTAAQRTALRNTLTNWLVAYSYTDYKGETVNVPAFDAQQYTATNTLKEVFRDVRRYIQNSDYRERVSAPESAHQTEYTDNFTTDTSATAWTDMDGFGNWVHDGTNLEADIAINGGPTNNFRFDTAPGDMEQESQITAIQGSSSTYCTGPIVRCHNSTTEDLYILHFDATDYRFDRFNAGSRTTIANGTATRAAGGDFYTLRLAASGGNGANVVLEGWLLDTNSTTKPSDPGWIGDTGTPDFSYTDTDASRLDDNTVHLYGGMGHQYESSDYDTRCDFFKVQTIADRASGVSEPIGNGVLELIGIAPDTSIVGNSTAAPPNGLLELVGVAPETAIVGNSTAAPGSGTLELVGLAPETNTVGVGVVAEGIPPGILTLTGIAPSRENNYTGTDSLVLIGFAPEAIRIGNFTESIPNNVIHLTGYPAQTRIIDPNATVTKPTKIGGAKRKSRTVKTVIIGGKRYAVQSYTEERYLLEQYLKRLQVEEAQEEAPGVRKRPVKLVSRNISLTETRIAKLDQRVEWHRKKLRQEDDLLLSLFG